MSKLASPRRFGLEGPRVSALDCARALRRYRSVIDDLLDPRLIEAGRSEATMITAPPDDSRILSLSREWVVAERVAGAFAGDEKFDGSDESDEALDRTNGLIAAISDIPAAGAAGLAIKSYLPVQAEDIMDRDDLAALSGEALADHACLIKSIVEDVICFVPELAPLAAAALARQPDDQAEEDDAEPEGIGFGEPDPGMRS